MYSLSALDVGVRNGEIDQLSACAAAMKSVLAYLQADRMSIALGSTRVVTLLVKTLHDRSQGAKLPGWFVKAKPKGGAPTHREEAVLRAEIVLQLQLLTESGMEPDEASRWLASELAKAGIRQKRTSRNPDGKIKSRQIDRWKTELGAKSMTGSDTAYRVLEAKELALHGWPKTIKEAQQRVLSRIRTLRQMEF
jgi:hypothetical protein